MPDQSSPEKGQKDPQFETLQVHAGVQRSSEGIENDTPIYASTSFVFNNSAHGAEIFGMRAVAHCYSRLSNPTTDVFDNRLTALEGGVGALSTSSVQAALFVTITTLASIGSNIIIASQISDTSALQFKFRLPKMGITARFVESGNLEEVRKAIDENTKGVYIETISTHSLLVADIAAIAAVSHESGVPLIVDNTAGAGGYLIRPFDHGADVIIHATTQYLSISGSVSVGVIIDSGNFPWNKHTTRFSHFIDPSPGYHGMKMWEKFGKFVFIRMARIVVLRDIGPCINPFDSFELISGLETLAVRVERCAGNALTLAKWLDGNKKVERVSYPGLPSHPSHPAAEKYLTKGSGTLLSFRIKDSKAASQLLVQKLKVVTSSTGTGGSKTTIIRRVPSAVQDFETEKQLEPSQNDDSIYVSVGLEHIDDIIADFEQALGIE